MSDGGDSHVSHEAVLASWWIRSTGARDNEGGTSDPDGVVDSKYRRMRPRILRRRLFFFLYATALGNS